MNEPAITNRYLYYGEGSSKHRNKVSGFLVEHLKTDDNNRVVARITPLGMFTETEVESMMTIEAMKKKLSLEGNWKQQGKSHRCKAVVN